jgi:signal transduction histidine kinase
MRRPFERRCVRDVFVTRWLAPLSLLVVILIVGNSLFSYGSLRSLYDRDAAVTHTELVRGGLNALLVTLDDAETGQRGYLLTGDQSYLRPYDNARTRVSGALNSLAGLTRDNPVQRGNLGRLTPLVREKLAELEQTVTLRRQGRQAAAVGIVRTNNGQRLMDTIRGVIATMNGEENRLLAGRTALARDGVRNATITIALATVVELALLVLTTALIGRSLAAHAAAAAARRRALEQEAELLRAANQRMDEFLSIVTHELRSPLTAIKGNVQLAARRVRTVADRLDAPARGRVDGPNPGVHDADLAGLLAGVTDLLARTDQVSARMTRLVTDLLDATRIGAGRLEITRTPADLTSIVAATVEEQRRAWPTREIALEASDGPIQVEVDAVRVTQVLINYITNALKYSDAARPIVVALRRVGAEARVGVRDEGVGLTPEQQERVWGRFHRVAGVGVRHDAGVSGGGLGLGLYISRQLIEEQGGRVGVDSAPGQGSTFWFTLPIAAHEREGRLLKLVPHGS